MDIIIVATGKVKKHFLQLGINQYLKRLQPYTDVKINEIADKKIPNNASASDRKRLMSEEGQSLLDLIPDRTYVIALDVKGKPMTSTGFARSIKNLQIRGYSSISFVIGGALGLSKEVLQKADYRLSLSHMTFTHQMVRLILLEQIYRAFKINRGEPYHK